MSLVVHGVNGSPFVRKVRVALHEKGIDYRLEPVMPFGPREELRRISPLGKIPVLQDGDYTLPDSSCIIAYLERTQPTPPLYPADAQELGRALFYEEWSDTKLSETIGPVFFQRYVQKNIFQQEPDEELVKQKLGELEPLFDWLEEGLGDREFLAGSHFSVADLAVGSILVNFRHAGEKVDPGRWPRLAAFAERVHGRPSFQTCLEDEAQGPDK